MEIILCLFACIGVVVALIVAGSASGRSTEAAQRAQELTERLALLEVELHKLRREQYASKEEKPAPAKESPAVTPAAKPIPEFIRKAEVPLKETLPPPVPEPELVSPPPPIVPPLPDPVPTPATPPPLPVFAEKIQPGPTAAVPPVTESVPAAEKGSLEMRLGTYWLVRIGIVMLLTGLAFFSNYAYHNIITKLGPGGKISFMYLASGLLLGAGAWWQRRNVKESLKNYAQVLFAGGLAAVYFTTYAAYHIPPLRVIGSAMADGTLLLLWAGVIAWIADRKKSEVMALFAVGLAFYSSVITRVGEFTLYSNLILTIAAVVFLVRNRWAGLSFASLGTTYAGYIFWRFLHIDGWRWAGPDENLTLGAGFLASYWLVFTVATFLSKSKNLSGVNRAVFLTLNNGLFFTLFLLTMLQVHNGGFWKFSLIYGIVLTGLAGLAKKFLPAEPFAKNGYLTQGLLLITLGFITKFAGLHLSLVLAMESVVLYLLAGQRQSLVFKCFAYVAAALASGWCIASLRPFNEEGLWTGAALGVLMAVNAVYAHRKELETRPDQHRLETTAFTLLAFAVWMATAWFNSVEPELAVTLIAGIESVVLYNWVARRQSPVPKVFAYLAAVFAVTGYAVNVKWFVSADLYGGAVLGLMMMLNAYESDREPDGKKSTALNLEPAAFSLLALVAWLMATWFNTSVEHRPLVLAAETIGFTASFYLLRVRELALLGQLFLVLAQVTWLLYFQDYKVPWWNPLALIAITVGLGHWWQKQKSLVVDARFGVGCQAVFALAFVGMVLLWLHPLVSAPTWLALTSVLAVAVTIYGVVTRAWPLAIFGQLFLLVGVVEFFRQVWMTKPEWFFPLAPVGGLMLLSFAIVVWFTRRSDDASRVRGSLLKLALAYRWVALAMSLCWLWQYVPDRQHMVAFMVAGIALFALGVWKRNVEALCATAVYGTVAITVLWARENLVMDVYWPNLLSLLAVFVMQQVLRRKPAVPGMNETNHGAIVLIAGLSLWRFVSCWAITFASGFSMTMIWAAFAVLVFAAGMILRERFHRWFGLGVLAAAVGRVVLVDVWKQETIYRVLTFMALGVALLVVGFVYNKFQEKIREWL